MKKTILFMLIIFSTVITCKRIKNMEQSVVYIVPLERLEVSDDIRSFAYFYNERLYISIPQKGIVGIGRNDIFLTIGEKNKEYNMPDKLSWENEFIEFLKNVTGEEIKTEVKKTEKRVFVEYKFSKVGKIVVGNDKSIFVEHIKDNGKEILKFSENGDFLYRLGRDGRDDQNLFNLDTSIIKMYVNKENGLWIKYVLNGMVCFKYFNKYGKNLLAFDENIINSSLTPYIPLKEGDYYQVEDIFPLMDSTNIGVIVNVYHKNDRYHIKDKIYIELNKNLSTESYWKFKKKDLVFFDINSSDNMVFFSYLPEENYNLIYMIDKGGSIIFEKKFVLRKFNAKKISLFLSSEGILTGVYKKDDNLVVLQWK